MFMKAPQHRPANWLDRAMWIIVGVSTAVILGVEAWAALFPGQLPR